MYQQNGEGVKVMDAKDRQVIQYLLLLVERFYPEAYLALSKMFAASIPNKMHYLFLMAHKFVRCNFGKFDGLTYDVDGKVMHLEEVSCPIRRECPVCGIVCKPKPFGLTKRETEIAKMTSSGCSYDEISEELGITHSTIKNVIQKIKEKLHLATSKDITKLFCTTL
jgi:DNA-binding CsgD family transcriptional regulator